MKKTRLLFIIFAFTFILSEQLFAQASSLQQKVTGYAPVNGLKIYYEIHGTGKPLLLLHGAHMSIDMNWGQLLPELSKTRKVIAGNLF